MFTVSLISSKGGSGKTTASANLAAAFSERGVGAIVDLDPQGNLSRAFPCVEWGDGTTDSVLQEAVQDPSRVIEPGEWTVYQLPNGNVLYGLATTSQDRLSYCQEILAVSDGGGEVLRRLLSHQPSLDWVIVDTPPSVGRLTLNAVAASDLVYTVINDAAWSVEGGIATKSYVEALVSEGVSRARFGGAILNRYDKRSVVARVVRDLVARESEFEVLDPPIPSRVIVQESEFRGVPAISLEPRSDVGAAFRSIADQIWAAGQSCSSDRFTEVDSREPVL